MKETSNNISLPIKFSQVVKLVRQLPVKQKITLMEVITKETKHIPRTDKNFTYIASEKSLAKDWLSKEEDEAWKDL